MLQKPINQRHRKEDESREGEFAVVESARSAQAAQTQSHREARGEDEPISLFWRIFGGTLLSMVALGIFTLYSNIASNIAELRADLNRERDARGDLIKKEEFNSRTSSQYERIRSFDGLKAEHEGLKERVNAQTSNLEAVKKDAATTADAMKKDAASLEILKEKLATVAADLKAMRADLATIQQEQERNRAGDMDRKASRDAQHKQLEELQKGLQDCREKIARLEGTRGMGTIPEPPSRPVVPAETK